MCKCLIARVFCFLLAILCGCGGSKDSVEPTESPVGIPVTTAPHTVSNFPDGDWSQFGAGPAGQRAMRGTMEFAASGVEELPFQMSEQSDDNAIDSTPVIGRNSSGEYQVYVVTSDDDNVFPDSDLLCFSAETLELIWQFETTAGNTNKATAAVGRDGTVYFLQHSAIPQLNEEGGLYAINPDDGSQKWKYEDPGIIGGNQVSAPVIWEDGANDRILLASGNEFWVLTDQGSNVQVDANFHSEDNWSFYGSPAVSPAPLDMPGSPSDDHQIVYIMEEFYEIMNPNNGDVQLVALDLQMPPGGPADEEASYYPIIDLGIQAMGPLLPRELDLGGSAYVLSENRWHSQPAIDNSGNVFVTTLKYLYGMDPLMQDLDSWPQLADFMWLGNPAITVANGQEIIAVQAASLPTTRLISVSFFNFLGSQITSTAGFPGLESFYRAGSPAFDADGNLVVGFRLGEYTSGGERLGNLRVFQRNGLIWQERLTSKVTPSSPSFHVDASPAIAVLPESGSTAFICCSDYTGDPDNDPDSGEAGGNAHLLKMSLDPWEPEPWSRHTVATNESGDQIAVGHDASGRMHIAWTTSPVVTSNVLVREAIETSPGSRVFATHTLDTVPYSLEGSVFNLAIRTAGGFTGASYVRRSNFDLDPALERRATFAYWDTNATPNVSSDMSSEPFVPTDCNLHPFGATLNSYWSGGGLYVLSHRTAAGSWSSNSAGNVPAGWTLENLWAHHDIGTPGNFHLKTLNKYLGQFPYQDGIYYGDVSVGNGTNETRVPCEWPQYAYYPMSRDGLSLEWFDASSGPLDDDVRPIIFTRVTWRDITYQPGMHCLVSAYMARSDGDFHHQMLEVLDDGIFDNPQLVAYRHTSTLMPNQQAVLCYSLPDDSQAGGFNGAIKATYFDYSDGDWELLGDSIADETVPGPMDSVCTSDTLSIAHLTPDVPHWPTTYTIYVSDQLID